MELVTNTLIYWIIIQLYLFIFFFIKVECLFVCLCSKFSLAVFLKLRLFMLFYIPDMQHGYIMKCYIVLFYY